MHGHPMSSARSNRFIIFSGVGLILFAGVARQSHAADRMDLPAVKPVMTCEQLAKADLGTVEGYPVTITSAAVIDTPKGQFCKVTGTVQQSTQFGVNLPLEHWTQRFLELAFNSSGISNGGSCAPAVNGEFAVGFNVQGRSGPPVGAAGTAAPQQRTESASNGLHGSVLATKALIKTFYGQPQRFSYFQGCSAGGGQAMREVQRSPEDFDGVSVGSPLLFAAQHNTFYHPWESYVNKRADGSRILAKSRIGILHDAVMAHCTAVSGALDGVLLQPTACKFDPSWVQCRAGATDTSKCLTAEEVGVIEKLYEGPGDGKGHHFDIAGFEIGSENMWGLSTADHVANPESKEGVPMTLEYYGTRLAVSALSNAGDTNIRPFQERGGKLILWNGAADLTIQPEVSIAYYQGVQKELGAQTTDSFMRLFLIPGFGHCEGGEIPFQFDVLTPLMAWTELNRAPAMILAGKPAEGTSNPSPFARDGGAHYPVAWPDRPNEFVRPVFPFPYMAHYSGKGDRNDPASYESVKSGAPVPQKFYPEVTILIGPGMQKSYHVENGQIVPDRK